MKLFALWVNPICLGMILAAALLILIGWIQTAQFLATTDSLRTATDMERYKQIARYGMWSSLALIVLLPLPMLILIFNPISSLPYRIAGVATAILVGKVSVKYKEKEEAMQSTPADDSDLLAERERVTKSWMKKPFPDF